MFLYFTIKIFWISGKGWLTSSRSIPDLSSPIAPAHRKTGKIIDCQYSVIVSSFFLMNVLSFLCLFSNVMCLFMPLLFWVNLCRPAFSLKLRFKHLLSKGSLFFFTIRYFLPRSLQVGCSLIYSTQYFLVTLNIWWVSNSSSTISFPHCPTGLFSSAYSFAGSTGRTYM